MDLKELKEIVNQYDSTYDHFDIEIKDQEGNKYPIEQLWVVLSTKCFDLQITI